MLRECAILACIALSAASGCARKAGVVFPPLKTDLVWPGGGEQPRIRYVGQLATSDDLKAGRSSMQGFRQTLFGKEPTRAMLTPFAVCTDGGNRVFVADSNAQLVHVFDLQTRRYSVWRPGEKQPRFTQPVGIAWDPAGRLLVSDSVAAAIFVFDSQGRFQKQIEGGLFKRPCGLAVQRGTGRIYVADSAAHQVVVLSPEGVEVSRIGERGRRPGEFNFPVDVALDSKGRLYVADALNGRVQQFSPDLKNIRIIGSTGDAPGNFAQPKCLDVDTEDHLYVIDNRFEAVQIFDAEGQLLLNFGQEGRGPGQFWLPTGIFIDARNRIWIADSYNRRVQVFDYLTAPAATPVTMPETK